MFEIQSFIAGMIAITGIEAIIYFVYKILTSKKMDDYELGEKGELKKHWSDE